MPEAPQPGRLNSLLDAGRGALESAAGDLRRRAIQLPVMALSVTLTGYARAREVVAFVDGLRVSMTGRTAGPPVSPWDTATDTPETARPGQTGAAEAAAARAQVHPGGGGRTQSRRTGPPARPTPIVRRGGTTAAVPPTRTSRSSRSGPPRRRGDAPGGRRVAGGGTGARGGASNRPGTGNGLPVSGFDEITLAGLRGRLRTLSRDDLRALQLHEEQHGQRAEILALLRNRLAKTAGAPQPPAGSPESPDPLPAAPAAAAAVATMAHPRPINEGRAARPAEAGAAPSGLPPRSATHAGGVPPVVADPVVADPVVADPVVADPVVADPAVVPTPPQTPAAPGGPVLPGA